MEVSKIRPYIEQKLVTEQVHPEFPYLSIFNYTNKCQIEGAWDEVTLQCRGLIIDTRTGEVRARPFNKFFNLEERDHAIPEGEKPHVFEKYDGSLGILYFVDSEPYIATRGSFSSDQAKWATEWFRRNVPRATQLDMAQHPNLNKYTHLFEIIYPENRIVVRYDFEGMVYIGCRDTETGKHYLPNIYIPNVRHAVTHKISTFEELKAIERENAEGFVVYYHSTDLFIKLKHGEYKRLHKLITGVNARRIWDILRSGQTVDSLLENVPDEFYQWVKTTAADLERQFNNIVNDAAGKHVEVKHMHTRKDQALALKGYQHAGVVFAMLDGKDYSQLIWRNLKPAAEVPFKIEV